MSLTKFSMFRVVCFCCGNKIGLNDSFQSTSWCCVIKRDVQ
uniref:Uncharacterized protein n=1 Tax=Anguilla anguilla TaxID=7936 RepID=A0A0E9PG30_ANGAN